MEEELRTACVVCGVWVLGAFSRNLRMYSQRNNLFFLSLSLDFFFSLWGALLPVLPLLPLLYIFVHLICIVPRTRPDREQPDREEPCPTKVGRPMVHYDVQRQSLP